jgi:hypothetical protein
VSRDANESQEIQIETTSSVREITKRKTLRTVTGLKTETLLPGDMKVYTWNKYFKFK